MAHTIDTLMDLQLDRAMILDRLASRKWDDEESRELLRELRTVNRLIAKLEDRLEEEVNNMFQYFEIITCEDGQWVPVEDCAENVFASEEEARQGIEELRALGEDWAGAAYDVRELDADELATRRL